MSKKIDTLHPKSDLTIDLYPNIQSENIPSDAITSDKLASNSVTNDKINNGAVTEDKIDNASITSDKIKEGAITTDKISDSAITSDKIKDYEITSKKLASGSVGSDALIDNSIEGQKLKTGAVGFLQLEDNAVITSKIKNYNVTEDKLAVNSVSSVKIQSNAVTNDKINNGAVTEDKIDNASITSDKIKEGAITTDKISDSAITSNKIANGAVGIEQLQDESITADKIATDQSMTFYDVDTSTLSASSITTNELEVNNGVFKSTSTKGFYAKYSSTTIFSVSSSNFYINSSYLGSISTITADTATKDYYLPIYQKSSGKLVINTNSYYLNKYGLNMLGGIICRESTTTSYISSYNITTFNGVKYLCVSNGYSKPYVRISYSSSDGINLDIASMIDNKRLATITTPSLENNMTYITSCSRVTTLESTNKLTITRAKEEKEFSKLIAISKGTMYFSVGSTTETIYSAFDRTYFSLEIINDTVFIKHIYNGTMYYNILDFTDKDDIVINITATSGQVNLKYQY